MSAIERGALVVTWSSAIPGREAAMLRVLREALTFTEALQAAGHIDDAELYVSKTGPNRDTLMLRGDLDQLSRLLVSSDLEDLLQDGMLVVQDVQVALWAGGSPRAVTDGIGVHAAKLQEHGLLPAPGNGHAADCAHAAQ